jgi:hypothetical protein
MYEIYLLNTIVLQKQSKKNLIIDKKTEIIKKQKDQILPNINILDNSYTMNKEDKLEATNDKDFKEVISPNLYGNPTNYEAGKHIIWEFYEPNPWSKIIYKNNEEYPFYFFIKIKIPSLNDYQIWKQLIPNIDFESRSGELIIPSKDEASALAVANLILSTFGGQIKLETILEKGLIQISVQKAQQFELVKNKLREQIIDNLQGKSTSIGNKDYEADLAKNNKEPSLVTEEFNSNEPMAAMPGEGYSYI